jgi:alpha-glucosidase
MSSIPVTWDDTIGLGGTPDTFAAVARRKSNAWYAAGLTNVDGRDFEIDTSFLSDGEWKMVMFCDTPESEKKPETYQIVRRKVRRGDKVPVRMASAGGFIALFVK